jgi:hypothetical protein
MAYIGYDLGSTTLILDGRVISDFVTGTMIQMTFPNPDTSRFNGANGGLVVGKREDATICDIEFHLYRGSEDDVWLSTILSRREVNIFNGSLSVSYKLDGKAKTETFTLKGGSITDQPQFTFSNTDGNPELVYKIQFREHTRDI